MKTNLYTITGNGKSPVWAIRLSYDGIHIVSDGVCRWSVRFLGEATAPKTIPEVWGVIDDVLKAHGIKSKGPFWSYKDISEIDLIIIFSNGEILLDKTFSQYHTPIRVCKSLDAVQTIASAISDETGRLA